MCLGVSKYATGTIWLCNLSNDNDNYEHGFCGTRPVLIISDGRINDMERACTVLPLSSADKYENYIDTYQIVKIETDRNSYIQCNAPIKVSINKLIKYLFTVSSEILNDVRHKFLFYLDLNNTNLVKTSANNDSTNRIIENVNTTSRPTNSINSLEIAETDINHKKDTNSKHRSKFPIGYWKDLSNNVECWNDRLTHSVDYCVKKYDRKDRDSWHKHIWNVKQFLLKSGFTETQLLKPIKLKDFKGQLVNLTERK